MNHHYLLKQTQIHSISYFLFCFPDRNRQLSDNCKLLKNQAAPVSPGLVGNFVQMDTDVNEVILLILLSELAVGCSLCLEI